MQSIEIRTSRRNEMIDITDRVHAALAQASLQDGLVTLWVPHTSG